MYHISYSVENGITSAGFSCLLANPISLNNLKSRIRLILSYLDLNNIGQRGAQYLAKGDLPQIQKLGLSKLSLKLGECSLADENIKHLAKGNWPKLR